jgi:arylsulfatase A-like enzyme
MPPNVLVVCTDQQHADTIAPGSATRTPNCDRIADRGVWFDRCYAPNTVCSPARASLMTGELPHTHGMTQSLTLCPPIRRSSKPTYRLGASA